MIGTVGVSKGLQIGVAKTGLERHRCRPKEVATVEVLEAYLGGAWGIQGSSISINSAVADPAFCPNQHNVPYREGLQIKLHHAHNAHRQYRATARIEGRASASPPLPKRHPPRNAGILAHGKPWVLFIGILVEEVIQEVLSSNMTSGIG